MPAKVKGILSVLCIQGKIFFQYTTPVVLLFMFHCIFAPNDFIIYENTCHRTRYF